MEKRRRGISKTEKEIFAVLTQNFSAMNRCFWLLLALVLLGCRTPQRNNHDNGIRVALVSDTHTAPESKRGQLFAAHLKEVIAQVNAAKMDVVIIAGDLTEGGKGEQIRAFRKEINDFRPPVLFVAGNHDVGAKVFEKGPAAVTPQRIEAFEKQLGPAFFSKTYGGLRIIGVTGSLFGSGLPREEEMWTFLEHELANPSSVPTILFCHYPPFIKTYDEPGGIYWNIEPTPRKRLLALLKSGGVKAMLTGHLHRPAVNRHEEILYLSGIPVSFGLPGGKQSPGWTSVTIFPNKEPRFEFKELPIDADSSSK